MKTKEFISTHVLRRFEKLGHPFAVLIMIVSVIGLGLVLLSLYLYQASGAAQLDLSRPGYSSIRDQVQSTQYEEEFSGTGDLTPQELERFERLYDRAVERTVSADTFAGNPLSDKALGLSAD